MPDHKPLPALPAAATVPSLTTLSVDARDHRGRFIRHILAEAAFDDPEGLWASALEDALDTLGDAVGRGRWLAGVKRSRRSPLQYPPAPPRKPMSRMDTTSTVSSSRMDTTSTVSSSHHDVSEAESLTSDEALQQIRTVAAQPAVPNPKPEPRHLLLCAAQLGGRIAIPSEDSGFDLIPANAGCVFKAALFSLPEEDSDARSSILFGLAEWDAEAVPRPKLVGGTFIFKGITSPPQYHSLCKALRISIYMHLSLLLEQHFLSNSSVQLHFPMPKPRHSAMSDTSVSSAYSQAELTPRSRQQKTFLPGILSFFSKKNPSIHRSNTITSTSSARTGASLDLTNTHSRESSLAGPARLSEDGGSRTNRFSFIGDPRPSFLKPAPPTEPQPSDGTPFTAVLTRLATAAPFLSSSAGVHVTPPKLIVDLAERERAAPGRRLTGDEKTALESIRGWDPRERDRAARTRALCGARGFARMQELGVLLSRYVPAPAPGDASLSGAYASVSASTSVSASVSTLEAAERAFAPCERPYWTTYRYYARDGAAGEDWSLGELVRGLCARAEDACVRPACPWKQGEHVLRLVHGKTRVTVEVKAVEKSKETAMVAGKEEAKGTEKPNETGKVNIHEKSKDSDKAKDSEKTEAGGARKSRESKVEQKQDTEPASIQMWMSCGVCGKCTSKTEMNDGAYLFSFGKFLEVLNYSPTICKITPALCEHTSPPLAIRIPHQAPSVASDDVSLPASRLNIVRHFAAQGRTVSFALSTVEDIFELRVPRLQITRRIGEKSARASITKEEETRPQPMDEEKRTLRREIKAWWEGVADHMDKLETSLAGTLVGLRKALPRLPSTDDEWEESMSEGGEDADGDGESTTETTPTLLRPQFVADFTPSAPATPAGALEAQGYFSAAPPPLPRASSDPTATPGSAAPTSTPAPTGNSMELLSSLRQSFHRTEQDLYTQLSRTPAAALNDVRRAFVNAARGAERRLLAWQKKHIPGRGKRSVQIKMEVEEPQWWGKGYHTVPGCNIIIREDDWGSIIAFTMSTADYAREVASMSLVRSPSSTPALEPLAAPATSSFFSGASNLKLFASSTQAQLDPDQEGAVWFEPEAYSAVISRKEHPRDATSLLSLREVLRQKSPIDGMSILPGGSRFGSLGSSATKATSSFVPPSARSKPDVQISRHEAGGEVCALPDLGESAGKILQEIDASSVDGVSRPSSAMSGSFLAGSVFTDMHIMRKAASILSVDSDSTIGGKSNLDDSVVLAEAPEATTRHEKTGHEKDATDATETPRHLDAPTSSFANAFTSGLTNAMRLMLNNGDTPRASLFSKNHHGLLAPADAFAIDERPHIKYDWTIGKRLKFSCTVYYAKQFDNLRKRCGIDDVFVKSLSRSANWTAEGGKSKSNFWKTADDRFIIKTLVNAWNVADLQVLIELAPSYFRYIDATASRATVLAKLTGFYTVEIRNLETGNVQSKADLLVMENLFYGQNIVKTFDLKGIQGRKIKSRAEGGQSVKTLFDGEWIEGQQRTLTLVRPHSKAVLREAIKSDAEFLAKSNIMDYSLLLGVDQERKQIACGLVDTIGSYTFAKTLEYKAKQGLNSGKEVTVIPPTEYQERFVSALEGYFLACPDKWSRAMDDSKPIDDPTLLPSVL